MKQYKTRPGVVLTTVAEQYVLVAAKSIREYCPYVTQINETAAFCWRALEEGGDLESLMVEMTKEYDIEDPAILRQDLAELLDQLKAANYLIEEH